jgi:hypothetical protein
MHSNYHKGQAGSFICPMSAHRSCFYAVNIPQWPLPAVRDLICDSRWSTYDVGILKLSNVSFRVKCARMGNSLKIPSPTKLARLGHFPPASQSGRLAGSLFYVYVFSLVVNILQRCVWAGWGGGSILARRHDLSACHFKYRPPYHAGKASAGHRPLTYCCNCPYVLYCGQCNVCPHNKISSTVKAPNFDSDS